MVGQAHTKSPRGIAMRRFDRSRALLERARQSLAGGVSSPVRGTTSVPLYFARGEG